MTAERGGKQVWSRPHRRRIRVLIAESQRMVREMFAEYLKSRLDAEVCGTCDTGAQAMRLINATQPDVVVLDWALPDEPACDVLLRGRGRCGQARFVVVVGTAGPCAIQTAVAAGATGLILRRSGAEEFGESVRCASINTPYLCPLASRLLALAVRAEGRAAAEGRLSPRELEVLRLVSHGQSTKEIASILGTSAKTVNNQLASLKGKLGIHPIAGLVRHAINMGLS